MQKAGTHWKSTVFVVLCFFPKIVKGIFLVAARKFLDTLPFKKDLISLSPSLIEHLTG